MGRPDVLIADDDVSDRFIISKAFEETGLFQKVSVVKDGEELFETLIKADADIPDVIIVDLNMNKLSGFDVTKKIKAIPRLNSIPIIIYSSSTYERDLDAAKEIGAAMFIVKPYDYEGYLKFGKELADFLEKSPH